ncbi:hypothetical protein V8B97DRAFT_2003261 [Scleroderma yunnanense]
MSNIPKSPAKYIIHPLQTNRPLCVSKEDYSRPCLGPRPVVSVLYPIDKPPKAGTTFHMFTQSYTVDPSFHQFEVVGVLGENIYEISFDSMGVADEDDRVSAYPQFPPERYVITYREKHQASTIMKEGTDLVWSHALEHPAGQQVHLSLLEESSSTVPDYQLFRFEHVPEDE